MPRLAGIRHVLVIGSGPIVIGQACEFDYSGTQACRVLRAEGIRVSLVNSNPATIMTDPEFADATYIEPITPEFVEKVIERERPDALLATLGGQTALNCAVALHEQGVLDKYDVKLIGATIEAIGRGEDRQQFKDVVASVGAQTPRSTLCRSLKETQATADELGLPVVLRPSYTMGGLGSGIARTPEELARLAEAGLDLSPVGEVLVEESVLGWKEYELELMRDRHDNVVVVCSIENIDPMGVHTGDSVTVAPAMTLTDREYQHMRDVGIAVLRAVGVETGGCNVQFAVSPETGSLVVIEMNPRVSRSSALASKATGFPIAKIAAKLAIGYFEKFPDADPALTTTMKSVGEAMAIGRNFAAALGKALRSTETTAAGFWTAPDPPGTTRESTLRELTGPHDGRLLTVERALRLGATVDQVHRACGIDPWFIDQILSLVKLRAELIALPELDEAALRRAKRAGLSDRQIAALRPEQTGEDEVRALRHALGIRPVYLMVDTCAAEFAATTPYYYSAYESESGIDPPVPPRGARRPSVLIIGSGPNRIGQGIEFDYCCVHAALSLGPAGFETVMINCNPETVSTDYDISDRLYFEPGVDCLLGPEMKSIGEVMGIDTNFDAAFAKAQLASGNALPTAGRVYVSVATGPLPRVATALRTLVGIGFEVVTDKETTRRLSWAGVTAGAPAGADDPVAVARWINDGEISLVISIGAGGQDRDGDIHRSVRAAAAQHAVPYVTTVSGLLAMSRAIRARNRIDFTICSLQDTHSRTNRLRRSP